MNLDDVVYVACLLACIGAGNYVRKKDQLVFTAIGCVIVVIVSGLSSLHCFISWLLGSAAIVYVHPSKCHLATFAVMFGYLTFFRLTHIFGLPSVPGHTNMIQMVLTLKVSGLAFEKTAAWKKLQQRERQEKEKSTATSNEALVEITDFDVEIQTINFSESFHYVFNYIGVLIGPYYRYKTYRDYFDYPFKDYAPHLEPTLEKLKYAGFYCVLYLIVNAIWPLEYALTDEFYNDRSFLYRLMYVWPTFFTFRMRLYTGLTLSECVCTMAGFGAYPDKCDTTNGEGPRLQNYSHLKRDADKHTYNFTTIVNTRFKEFETCQTLREGMKHWNISVQYWLAVNVYKLFPNKKFRMHATLFCSAYWHGFRPGHYFTLMGSPFYVMLEDCWNKLVRLDATGNKRFIIDVVFWIMKFFGFSYLGITFQLVTFSNIWRYYSSVYFIGYIGWAILMALGIVLTKNKKFAKQRGERTETRKDNNKTTTSINKPKIQ